MQQLPWNPGLVRPNNFGPGDLHSLVHNVYSPPVAGVGPILAPPAPPFGNPGLPGWMGPQGGVIGWRDFFTYGITAAATQWATLLGQAPGVLAAAPYGNPDISCFLCGNFFPMAVPAVGHPGYSTVEHFLPSACAFIIFGLTPSANPVLNQEVAMGAAYNPLANFDAFQYQLLRQNFGYAHSYCNSRKSDLLFLDVIRFSPNTIVQGAPPPYSIEFAGFNGVGIRPVTYNGNSIDTYLNDLFSTVPLSAGKIWLREISLADNPLRPGQPPTTTNTQEQIVDYAEGTMTAIINPLIAAGVAGPPLANIYDNWNLNSPWSQHARMSLTIRHIRPAMDPLALTFNNPAPRTIQSYFYGNLRYALFKAVAQIYRIMTGALGPGVIPGIGAVLQPAFLQVDYRIQALIASQALVVQGGGINNDSHILENINKLTTDSNGQLKLHPHDLTIICIGFYIDMYNDFYHNRKLYDEVIERMNNSFKTEDSTPISSPIEEETVDNQSRGGKRKTSKQKLKRKRTRRNKKSKK